MDAKPTTVRLSGFAHEHPDSTVDLDYQDMGLVEVRWNTRHSRLILTRDEAREFGKQLLALAGATEVSFIWPRE